MKQEINLQLSPFEAGDKKILEQKILQQITDKKNFTGYRILRKSIDARKKNILINLKIEVFIGEEIPSKNIPAFHFDQSQKPKQVLIIGAGPAGLFAALQLLEKGIKPIIIERGKKVKERRRDIAVLNKQGIVNPDSNYCFGEGGAGTYSDGKLYTRSTKRGDVNVILGLLVMHGAGEEILYEAHPHIGTNKLPQIIENIRETILNNGGEFYFETRLTDFILEENNFKGIITKSVVDGTEKEFRADHLILATGHSARDIYQLMDKKNMLIEAKPFAMGVRVEHHQELIDGIQYHCNNHNEVEAQRKFLPASSYSMVHQSNGRGVYSFCMCPGGIIAPCATMQNEVVVNGWSPSKRNNPFANSGVVVAIELEDLVKFSSHGKLAGLHYQMQLEQMAFDAGGKTQAAPAQRLEDFVKEKLSSSLPKSSYQPGISSAPLHELLPIAITSRLRDGFSAFGRKMKGYLTNEAVIHGVESRTSSPIRIPRDRETFEHPQIKGLFPVGEGAGFAGGIISAAIDGQQCALRIACMIA